MLLHGAIPPLANALIVLIGLCVVVVVVTAILWSWSARRRAVRNAERFSDRAGPQPGVSVDPWLLAATRINTPSADALDRDRLDLEDTRTPLHDHHHPDGTEHQHPHDPHGHHGPGGQDDAGGGLDSGSGSDFGSGGGGGMDSGGGFDGGGGGDGGGGSGGGGGDGGGS